MGAEHILMGYDHLLFVFGLILLVGFRKKLIITATAFTLAHSLTLAASMVDAVAVNQRFVELLIALSICLVAVEGLRNRATLASMAPSVVAFLFGLIHGLGFAGALKDIGLPADTFVVSLLAFNFGVELGQIAVLVFAWCLDLVVAYLVKSQRILARARTVMGYLIGGFGTFWFVERLIH
ncbi:hypothetical protein GCM10025791_25070 [Halioxenophilus aromaticivorans]|uniref:HupE/UreJ family protein n=2 Tax=Halioxenophilus aromaticivorans TaxID=1306992 RepID=A0AAV3U323_9ALTE